MLQQKISNIYIIGLMMGLCLASCNEDDVNLLGGPDDDWRPSGNDNELVITASKKGQLLSEDTWKENHQLGFFLTKGSLGDWYENDSLTYANIRATMKAGFWRTSPEYIRLTQNPGVIYAYSPYRQDVDPKAIPIETHSQTEYLFGSHIKGQEYVKMGQNYGSVELGNALCMVELNLRKNEEFEEDLNVDKIEILPAYEGVKIPVEGTLNIETGEITPTGYGQYTKKDLNLNLSTQFLPENKVRFLTMPRQNEKGEIKLVIRFNDKTVEMLLGDEYDWAQGTRNIYYLTCKGNKIHLDEFRIEKWESIYLEGEF